MNRLRDYLSHILEAISRTESYTAGMDETAFLASQITQDAVIRNIEIIGEAGRNISRQHPEFAAAHPHLRLNAAYVMRNKLSHGYFEVDLGIVWSTVQIGLPVLRSDIIALMGNLP